MPNQEVTKRNEPHGPIDSDPKFDAALKQFFRERYPQSAVQDQFVNAYRSDCEAHDVDPARRSAEDVMDWIKQNRSRLGTEAHLDWRWFCAGLEDSGFCKKWDIDNHWGEYAAIYKHQVLGFDKDPIQLHNSMMAKLQLTNPYRLVIEYLG